MQAKAEPAASEQIPAAKPRSIRFVALGLVLLALGVFLFWSYASDPTGTLPGFPQVWKGGPLILSSSFLIILGAFCCFLKRFSLGGLLLSAVAAGLFTAALQAYVYSFREYDTDEENRIVLENKALGEILARNTRNLTSDRVLAFMADAYSSSRWPKPPNFDEASVNLVPDHSPYLSPFAPGTQYYKLEIRFRFSAYMHESAPPTRRLAASYASLLFEWNVLCALGQKPDAASEAQRFLNPGYQDDSRRTITNTLEYLCRDLAQDLATANTAMPHREAFIETMHWLAEREPDEELKKYISDFAGELETHWPRSKAAKP
ncbi:MAG: hypothetical protein HY291_22875 [Planctomycetes bacterium]|nr:hypothetical protein [Planctomycetota bacterium]